MKLNQLRLLLPIAALTLLSATSFAQSRSSFTVPDALSGITITQLNATDYNVALAVGSTVTIGGSTNAITDVFGFWALDDNDDLSATGSTQGAYSFNANYSGAGGIVGFKTNPNTGITQGTNQTFHFDSIAGTVEGYGVHLRITNGLTYYMGPLTGTQGQGAVPEPASYAVLGLGGLLMIRRKRTK